MHETIQTIVLAALGLLQIVLIWRTAVAQREQRRA